MITLVLTLAVAQLPASQDFVTANELALKGEHASAIALYEGLVKNGVIHEDLYFNLGNAYAEAGRDVDAIVAWERALRIKPGDQDVLANLETVRARSEKNADATHGDVVTADVVEPLVAAFDAATFVVLTLIANALAFGALALRRLSRSEAKRRRAGVAALGSFALLLVFGTIVAGHVILARDPRAIVVDDGDLREGPHARFKSTGKLVPGARVRVLEEDGAFSKVLGQDGTTGWAETRMLTRV